MYADYTFYEDTFLGTKIKESNFDRLELRASEYIDFVTFHRSTNVTDENTKLALQKAACALAELMQEQDNSNNSGSNQSAPVASESIGRQSISYAVASAGTAEYEKVQEQKRYSVLKMYLSHTGLLFKGVHVAY